METQINGQPAFAHVRIDLSPGESIVAESDAMASMDGNIDVEAKTNGGPLSALAKRFFGKESFFVSRFRNNTRETAQITLTQATPGDIRRVELNKDTYYLQPGAFIAATPGISLGLGWAGVRSCIAREGLFRLKATGSGQLFYGAYGGLLEKEVHGEYIVDTSHLVAYEPGLKIRLQLAGGIFSSLFGGEGLVTRVEGHGRIIIQTRSVAGLIGWLNPKLGN